MQARTPPAPTMTERTPPEKCTLPAPNKERALRTRDPQSGGAYVGDGRDKAWRSRAPGPHTHTEKQRGRLWTAWGWRWVDSKNSQTTTTTTSKTLVRQLLGTADAQTAHHATLSTAPAHQPLGSANAETTPAGAPAAAADRKQQPDATCEGTNR